MKKRYLCLAMVCLISCTAEMTEFSPTPIHPNRAHKGGDVWPANSDNPYDYAGALHNEILISYYDNDSLPATVPALVDRVELVANDNRGFTAIKGLNYTAVTSSRVAYILEKQSASVDDLIGTLPVSARAKESLTGFIDTVLDDYITEDDYEVVYDFIANYESTVISDQQLNSGDRQTILTITSIARHSAYIAKKKPKKNTDPDWDWMTANITAGLEGVSYGTAEAITMALAAGIAEN